MNKPTLLLPVAGKAERFKKAGIDTPKPLIKVKGKTIIEWALSSIADLDAYKIVFVVHKQDCDNWGLHAELRRLFGSHITIVEQTTEPIGALDSCMKAEEECPGSNSLTIFTPDAMFKPAFDVENLCYFDDGLLSLYPSQKPSCSYAKIVGQSVMWVAEKQVISPYATTGLYHFRDSDTFFRLAGEMLESGDTTNGEFYIAPIYNRMIKEGMQVAYEMVERVDVLGTPEECQEFEKCSML